MTGLQKKSVLVPCDFSDESFAAVDVALTTVENASDIHVIHVLPELNVSEPGVIWDTVSDDSRSEHTINALKKRLSDAKYQDIHMHVAFGDPGEQIVATAEKNKIELIILPSHGRTGISRLLIGSVAERVVRLAHCPVLVLRS